MILPAVFQRSLSRMNIPGATDQIRVWAALVPFGVFCFVYPFAVFLLSFDLMPFGMEWMSSLLLAMLGLSMGAWLWLNFGGRGALAATAIFLFGLGLEYIGVTTGIPFGRYAYTGVLVPGLPGSVPLAIGFAWVFIIGAGLFTARWLLVRLMGKRAPTLLALSLLGALLAVGLDLLLEPVAFHVKHYWNWLDEPAGYYGVPWINFAAWFLAALVMNILVLGSTRSRSSTLALSWLPVALYTMNVALFGVVNLAHGLWVPALLCMVIITTLFLTGLRQRQLHVIRQ